MSKRACIALICLVLATAACARPQYEEEPHHDEEYKGGDEHREHEHEQEYEPKEEPNYYPREEYNAYDSDEHYASLTLQEVKVQDFQTSGGISSYKALFTCGEEKANAKECREASRHRRHGDQEFLQTTIMPDYVASCTIAVQNADPNGDTALCHVESCVRVDLSCTVFKSAKKCGCPLEPGFGFNATGSIDTFSALSCSPSYISNGVPPGSNSGRKRALLAENSPAYLHPHNETVYSGTAIAAHAHVTASSAGYNYDLNHELKHAKVVYVGGFLRGVPVSSPEAGGYQDEGSYKKQLPFVTGGLLKLIVKK